MFDETCEALGVFKCAILEQSYQINLCLCFKRKRSDSGTVVNSLKKCVIGTVFLYQIVSADTKTSCRHRKWRKWIRASLVSTQRIYIFFFTKQIKLSHIKLRLCWNFSSWFILPRSVSLSHGSGLQSSVGPLSPAPCPRSVPRPAAAPLCLRAAPFCQQLSRQQS